MPLAGRPWVVAAGVAYLALVLGIGLWSARRTRTLSDYFVAGRRIGLFVTGITTMSAAFSGFVFIGGPGLTYSMGVSSFWIFAPVGFTAGLLCWVVAHRLRGLATTHEVYTVPDAIGVRFGPGAAGAAAVATATGTLAYLAAQLLALGFVIRAVFPVDSLGLAIALGLFVLLAYGTVGGMVAGVYTDLVQGILMLGAAVAVFRRAFSAAGGWAAITEQIEGAGRTTFFEPLGGAPVVTALGFFFVFGIGVLGQPQMLHKFYMLDDPRKLRWLPMVLGGSQLVCLLVWVGIGVAAPALVARGLLAEPVRPDELAPAFLLAHAPQALAGLVLAAALAAIMSTADSLLNIGSAALVRDLPRALGRPVRRELLWSRWAVIGIGGAAGLLAVTYGDLIALLGTFAFGTFSAALAPTVAVGLSWRGVTGRAACASIVTGLVLNLGLEGARRLDAWPAGVVPSAVALAASFSVLLIVSLSTREPGEAKLAV